MRASGRYFEATIPAPDGSRFDERYADAFRGLALVMVDGEGRPADARRSDQRIRDLRITVRTTLEQDDAVFGWVLTCRVLQDGERLGLIFEPEGRVMGPVERLFGDLMAGLGVTEVADITEAWKMSAGIP